MMGHMSRRKSATKETAAAYGEPAEGEVGARVGIRELRDHLSRHIDAVKAGATLTITEHGRAVARISPIHDTQLEALIAAGVITPPTRPKSDLRLEDRPIVEGSPLTDALFENRREAHAELLRSIGVDEDPADRD
jgi:prevent-host-death family protein